MANDTNPNIAWQQTHTVKLGTEEGTAKQRGEAVGVNDCADLRFDGALVHKYLHKVQPLHSLTNIRYFTFRQLSTYSAQD